MADDARGNVLKGLGVKRRREGGDDEPAEAKAEPTPKKASSGPPLGIRRRGAAAEEAADDDADAADEAEEGDEAADASAAPSAGAASALGIQAAPDHDPAGPPDPLAEVRPRLGNTETSVVLTNYFKSRPGIIPHLPPRLLDLERTHGLYQGNGQPARRLKLGWRPAVVIWTIPTYPDGPPEIVKSTGQAIDPGLNRQPLMHDDGFEVDGWYNVMGDTYVYIAFKDDGQPLLPPEPQDKRGRRARGEGETKKTTSGPKLGIKRRSK